MTMTPLSHDLGPDHADTNTDTDTDLDAETGTGTGGAVADRARPRRWRWVKWTIAAVVAGVIAMYGAIFLYATVLNDAPDRLDTADLSEALVEEPTEAPSGGPSAEPTPVVSAETGAADGVWLATEASEFGYRVDEVLSGVNVTAVGRSNEITGELTIDGTSADIDVSVEVADIRSDNGSRDSQFAGRIMNAAEFPTATFSTTSSIEFGEIPDAGEQITTTVTGDLTLRGVTRSVTFDVTAELVGERIGVLGAIPIVFDDYDIPEPSIGTVRVEDNGLIEFVLVFDR